MLSLFIASSFVRLPLLTFLKLDLVFFIVNMPKGEKTIIWTAENDCLLLKGILIYGNVQVTAQAADEIAKHMGMVSE